MSRKHRAIGSVAALFAAAALGPFCQALGDDADLANAEVVANPAAGRVLVAVVKNAILVVTAEDPIEPGTHLPVPVELSSVRAGVLLGAVDWVSPSLGKSLGRLDQELPHLRAAEGPDEPRLGQGAAEAEASDIEAIGKPLRDRLGELAGQIHSELAWPRGQPVAELIVADYLTGYGPEVWQLTYSLTQEQQKGDYWVTYVDGPVYLQIWPPEKNQPHTLMEFDYPPSTGQPTLLDLLRAKDPRLNGLATRFADVTGKFLSGDSLKIAPAEATEFLRGAMATITPAAEPEAAAILRPESGWEWILAPPAEPKSTEPSPGREPGAPSLAHPSPKQNEPGAPSLAHPLR